MTALSSIAPNAFVSRPQAPLTTARPTQGAKETDAASPTREADSVQLSPAVAATAPADAVTPVTPVEGAETSAVEPELTEAEEEQVRELKARDAEVKAHEQAHVAAAGPYFRGGPNYSYQKGPDGNRYAVGGSVQIDTSPVPGDPEATIAKAQTVRRAALAPAEPSNTDRQVAAAASRMEAKAQRELSEQNANPEASSDTAPAAIGEEPRDDATTEPITEPAAENDSAPVQRTTGVETPTATEEPNTDDALADPSLTRTGAGEQRNARGETQGGVIDVFA